ncbi:hypothetical protein [Dryocola sp. LX212]
MPDAKSEVIKFQPLRLSVNRGDNFAGISYRLENTEYFPSPAKKVAITHYIWRVSIAIYIHVLNV